MARAQQNALQQAESVRAWLTSLDYSALAAPDGDPAYLERIGRALATGADSQAELALAVRAAKEEGAMSWTQVAAVLGVTRQAAREKFGDLPRGIEGPPVTPCPRCGRHLQADDDWRATPAPEFAIVNRRPGEPSRIIAWNVTHECADGVVVTWPQPRHYLPTRP